MNGIKIQLMKSKLTNYFSMKYCCRCTVISYVITIFEKSTQLKTNYRVVYFFLKNSPQSMAAFSSLYLQKKM